MTQERTPVSTGAPPMYVCAGCGNPFYSGNGPYMRYGFPGEYHKRCFPVRVVEDAGLRGARAEAAEKCASVASVNIPNSGPRLTLHPPLETSPDLLALIERAKSHNMTPEEIDAQRRSWVRGQMGLTDPSRTPEQIDATLNAVLGPPLSAQLAAAREAGRMEGLEEAARHLETVRAPREPYGHAKAAVMLDAAAIRELIEVKR